MMDMSTTPRPSRRGTAVHAPSGPPAARGAERTTPMSTTALEFPLKSGLWMYRLSFMLITG